MELEVAKTFAMEVSVEAELAKTPQAAMEVTVVAELETTSTACDAGGWANAARGRGVVQLHPGTVPRQAALDSAKGLGRGGGT